MPPSRLISVGGEKSRASNPGEWITPGNVLVLVLLVEFSWLLRATTPSLASPPNTLFHRVGVRSTASGLESGEEMVRSFQEPENIESIFATFPPSVFPASYATLTASWPHGSPPAPPTAP